MICSSCGEEMVPLRDLICASGTETCCVPCWNCPTCNEVQYLHNESEFDRWMDEYTDGVYFESDSDDVVEQEAKSLDKETLRLISTGV